MNQDGLLGNRTGSSLAVDDGGALARGVEGVSRGYWVGRSEPVLVGRPSWKFREFPRRELGGGGSSGEGHSLSPAGWGEQASPVLS